MEDWNVDLKNNFLFYDHLYSLCQDEFCHSNITSFCHTHYSLIPVFQHSNCERTKLDNLVKSQKMPFSVIPAKAGIQSIQYVLDAGSSPA